MTVKLYIHSTEPWVKFELLEADDAFMQDAEFELSHEEWADYRRVCREYEAWQERLEAAIPPVTPEEVKFGHRRQGT